MKNTWVSVVIPTFDRASMLPDALESVWAQTYRPLELIIVDDGSEDGTAKVVEEWRITHTHDDFQVCYFHQKNQGGNAARNFGIEKSTSEFVAFLDSDDAWHPEKLALQLAYFTDRDVGGVYCGVRHVDFLTKRITEPDERVYPKGRLLEQLLTRDVTAQTSAYVVRREVFSEVGGFDVALHARQDWDMWIRLASKYRIECVPQVLVDFREHAGPRTGSNPKVEIEAYRRIRIKYRKLRRQTSLICRFRALSAYHKRLARIRQKHQLSFPKAILHGITSIVAWPFDFDAYAAFIGLFLPAKLRAFMHRKWNAVFGRTHLAIRSH